MKRTGNDGIELIKEFEGLELEAYRDSVGVLTIGYGHTKNVFEGQKITEERAEELLKEDLKDAERWVNRLVKQPIDQNQFDALVSFTYNLGAGSLQRSTLLKVINRNPNSSEIEEQFKRWTRAGGKILKGLVRRRAAESDLYNKKKISGGTSYIPLSRYSTKELLKEVLSRLD